MALVLRLPCTTQVAEDIPGVIPPIYDPSSPSDENLVVSSGTTDAVAGTWTQLMLADSDRMGASIQNESATDSIFILVHDTGLPAAGSQPGEIEIPPAPGYFSFDYRPTRRYVVRGEAASISYNLQTW